VCGSTPHAGLALSAYHFILFIMLHSGKARLNHEVQSQRSADTIKQQHLRLGAIRIYEDARYDSTVDARHLETLRVKAYGN